MSPWIREHRLAAFFGLTLLVTWLPWPFWAIGLLPFAHLPIGPLFAALVVIGIAEGAAGYRELGSRLIRWRVGWQWWLVAAATPLAVLALAALANVTVFGAPAPVLSSIAWGAVALTFAIRWVDPLDGALGEEPGFRGYAVPLLQVTRTPLGAATVLGAFAAVWHLPLVVAGQLPLYGIPVTLAITYVYVWLFNRSGGSLLMTLLFHVVQGSITYGMIAGDGADAERMGVLAGALWIVLAIGLVVVDRDAWRVAPASAVADSADRRVTV